MRNIAILLVFLQVGMLSQFVSRKEAYYSKMAVQRGIVNVPSPAQEVLIKRFCREYIDPLRLKLGTPIHFNSFYRCPKLNEAVGGASSSDHMVLDDVVAADLDTDGKSNTVTNAELFYFIRENTMFYKIIWEFGSPPGGSDGGHPAWVHIGWSTNPNKNMLRRAYLAYRVNNRTVYEIFK